MNEYEYVEGYDHENTYSDSIVFDIDPLEKRITALKSQTLIAGEENSQYIAFEIPRYVDGIDLSTKTIQVLYIAPEGFSDINRVINVARNDEMLRFGWVVPGEALTDSGVLTFAIEFTSSKYMLKVKSIEQEICDGLSGSEISPEPTEQAWYVEIQQRCKTLLDSVEQAKKDVQTAVKAVSDLSKELDEVKKRGSDVKERLAAVITEKGVETASGDGWDVVIGNAEKIPTGGYVVPAQAISANGAHGEENIVLAQAISANVYLGDKEATI
jgi:hypothetical protein|nr:MAG TPA: hypothetical protein [Caudoviricetes sp.]